MKTRNISMIMLAAGCSSRFGSNKLLYEIDGKPMFLHTLEKLTAVRERYPDTSITVVTRYRQVAKAAKKAGARVLYNHHPEEGIASSLRLGLKANLESVGCLFTVADQPWLEQGSLEKLLRLWLASPQGIACVQSKGKMGNPCIFSKKYYPALLTLRGDKGGKQVAGAHPEDTVVLEVTPAELMDIDVPELTGE